MYKEFKMKKKMKNVFAHSMQMCTGAKLKKSVGGVHNARVADKQTSFKPDLPTKRTFLEFCRQR